MANWPLRLELETGSGKKKGKCIQLYDRAETSLVLSCFAFANIELVIINI